MRVYAIVHICPECRRTIPYIPSDGTFNIYPMQCAEDGYMMKRVAIDEAMVDNLLKHGTPDAPSETTRA